MNRISSLVVNNLPVKLDSEDDEISAFKTELPSLS